MLKRWIIVSVLLALSGLAAGCFGESKSPGKFSDQDKQKSVEAPK